MADTRIEWVKGADGAQGKTWNPVIGCTRISPGCQRCYAERIAARFSGPGLPYEGIAEMTEHGARWTRVLKRLPERLEDPLRRRKPTTYFVNSMSDLFHEDVPFNFIDQVCGVMVKTFWHTFQVLTKRPERMAEYFARRTGPDNVMSRVYRAAQQYPWPKWAMDTVNREGYDEEWPWRNIWLGTSVENQETADKRIPYLLQTPAAVRFLSCEPLLGPVNIEKWLADCSPIHWVIVGGESGPGARPMHPDWVRSLRDQCQAAGVPFFYKQRLDEKGHKVSLPELDDRTWNQMPQRR